jgi:TRAP-type uncharacterized transport system substrate-binding protein
MSKSWMMLTCVLSLGSVGTSQAHPLDSPDIVYIDGMPCNSACQSYMAWSRQTLSMSRHPAPTQLPQRSANEVAHRATTVGGKRLKPAAHARIARQAAPFHREMPRATVATLQPTNNAAAKSDVPPDKASAAASSSAGTRTIQEQVAAATALAEHATAATMAPVPEQKSNNTGRSNRSETVPLSDAEKAASAPPNNANNLVALLMARPEIKSVSDLTNKKIAIDDRQAASSDSVRTAIAAAGAAEVQLSNSQTRAIDRLISGEVPAAVLTSAYPEAAGWFPEIAGFKIFRIPLAPRSLQARLEPAGNAAAGSSTRTIQEQVTAATAVAEHVTAAAASASSNTTDLPVALLMARPEIKSVSDLTNKNIAIDDRQSASNGVVRSAIAAAGATEVQLNEGHTKAIDRLISGEVPAAVLTLVSQEAAEWFPEIAGFKIFRIPLSSRSLRARQETAGNAAAKSVTTPATIADSPPKAGAAANSNTRTIQEQVMAATAVAEQVTAATAVPVPEQKANNTDRSETIQPGDAEKTASASPNNTDLLVVLLMARPEIKSVSDLNRKDIAIDDRQSASNDSVRTAIATAGATEVQLSKGQTKAINRLISGEVPAAVLSLVSPEAADWFPEIAGFKIFRIPLSSRS